MKPICNFHQSRRSGKDNQLLLLEMGGKGMVTMYFLNFIGVSFDEEIIH